MTILKLEPMSTDSKVLIFCVGGLTIDLGECPSASASHGKELINSSFQDFSLFHFILEPLYLLKRKKVFGVKNSARIPVPH